MRDLLLFGIFFILSVRIFALPHYGVYLWTWISLMNPHRLTWGAAYDFPFGQIVAIATLIGLLTGKYPPQKVWFPETIAIAAFMAWITLNAFVFAVNPVGAFAQWETFVKIQLFIFLAIFLIADKKQLNVLVLIFAASIAFYGFKGGIFAIITGGAHRIWGPAGSSIAGNNELALALLMISPLLWYLRLQADNIWLKRFIVFVMLLCLVSVVGTHSRGALLGIVSIGLFFVLKSRQKVPIFFALAIATTVIVSLMPEVWWERMRTIENYEEDSSAMSRLNSWQFAWNVARDTFVGGGPGMWNREMYAIYAPDPNKVFDAHSIYFEVLGEQGFPGLFLFLAIGWLFWRRCSRMIRQFSAAHETRWAADLAAMLQVSFIGYAVSGAFLGLAYFDVYFNLIAVGLIGDRIARASCAQPNATAVIDTKTSGPRAMFGKI